ncbi:MAG: hypothetical protein FWF26_02365 [Treponema sp.]|nr:hypothetical protein [Treponema sp.]
MYSDELKLYQRSLESIWTDDYISKSLLSAHLDESNDDASRKYENRIKIENLINKNVKTNSKIIDLGCGPGLYSFELGKLGHRVLGVDFNKKSIGKLLSGNGFAIMEINDRLINEETLLIFAKKQHSKILQNL